MAWNFVAKRAVSQFNSGLQRGGKWVPAAPWQSPVAVRLMLATHVGQATYYELGIRIKSD
jgi:hypothetical protein